MRSSTTRPSRMSARASAAPSSGRRAVQFRPCIDIHKGKVKQIVGSTLRDSAGVGGSPAGASAGVSTSVSATVSPAEPVTNFETEVSASEFAGRYARDGLRGGHVIMLGADRASRAAAFEALEAYPGGLQLGGGVTADNACEYLERGASHVIVTSYVFREGALDEARLAALVEAVGKERLVLDLSCRRKEDGEYYVVTDRWQRFSELRVCEATLLELARSCDEFLVHAVDVEGKKLGMDAELIRMLGEWSPIPVTYAGGAGCVADLDAVATDGKGRVDVTVGSALDIFGGQLPYDDVVAWHNKQTETLAA